MLREGISLIFLAYFVFNGAAVSQAENFDLKVVTSVRHGLELSLDYIEENLFRTNVDCLLGVAFVRALTRTSYHNGTHVMDNSSIRLYSKAANIIEQARRDFENDVTNGNDWKFKYLVDEDIWSKNFKFKNIKHLPALTTLSPIEEGAHDRPNSDVCLQEIINSTKNARYFPTPCIVSNGCWNGYFRNRLGHGYILTHKMLLLQVAKARDCSLVERFYNIQVRDICSMIMLEIVNKDRLEDIEDVFDLFLEQVLLCGYEGFTEFLQTEWLYFILKSQRPSGCFPDILSDSLKSRIKKDMTYFEDGCNDHTTGLAAAVLALYYHYIVEENSI